MGMYDECTSRQSKFSSKAFFFLEKKKSLAGEMSRETEMSIAVSELYPGFRFSPTDVELICYYLRRKIAGEERSVAVIPEVDIYNYEPWDLPDKSILKSEGEWFFFCARGRRYPHGSQSRRATGLGYWKATGKERNVKMGTQVVGTKRTLVFHIGRAPRGDRTEWIMHEYCLIGAPPEALVVCRLRKNCDFRANNNSGKKQMQDADCDDHSNMSNDCFHHTDGGASEGENKNTDSFSASASEWKLWNDTNAESSNNANIAL
ncbi:PREDICTED: NAC domain-containing protein 40 isoform X2 [Tarenaya hassleriana]|uniref:NAC domain-containing protein 40 isoform X2 n=1 Tax=Tarenaya hassleriana TaxID=28532 RepID=UPI00053C088F|nr:PREDICTED: NAC domain-containing protein 40 isoform X2 [Tarenaya hassleriana]